MLGKKFDSLFKIVLTFLVLSYKALGSVHMGGGCRYQPSCSDYAMQALKEHNSLSAFKLISKRLWSCRPGGNFGYDPVPIKQRNHTA